MSIDMTELYENTPAWPFEQARALRSSLLQKGKPTGGAKGYVLFETGYGPSGLPHIGTFGEVFRTSMVRQAFEKLCPHIPTRLICFSDDMDALRKVPDNVPNKEMLTKNLGKPLTQIPDPFGEYKSFGEHNNAMLQRFLDAFGFPYEFASATSYYTSGRFNAALHNVLAHHQKIVDIVTPTLGEERAGTYSPFLPVCPETGRVLQVPVIKTDVNAGTITYRRNDGREVETTVTNGNCKLQWKADWAMRWVALDVDYEMSGKDLIDSVVIGSKIAHTLGGTPPLNLTYEHFVDENGAKISKSKGNGVTIEEFLKYAPNEALSHFMYRTPTRAKKLYRSMIPVEVETYADLVRAYPTQTPAEQLENPAYHIHNGNVPADPLPFAYGMLINLASVTATDDANVIWRYLQRFNPSVTPANHPKVTALIKNAMAYYTDTIKPTQTFHTPTDAEKDILRDVVAFLKTLSGTEDAEAVQTGFYELGKKHYGKERLRDWFGFLYKTLLGFPNGPRLGTFVKIYGEAETITLVQKAIG
ncbi:MAG TPA: lysine--tRNA ligase [Alphaproteobacteria bacterium]|nr:lysine--tRNA ligase [Alphaproteobacteria bacterium]